jgi:hypothetical protein
MNKSQDFYEIILYIWDKYFIIYDAILEIEENQEKYNKYRKIYTKYREKIIFLANRR